MYNPRTYGKRGSMKRKEISSPSSSKLEPMPSMEELGAVQKRRKLTASPEPRKESPSPPPTISDSGSDNIKRRTRETPVKVYGTPRKKAPVHLQSTEMGSKTPVRDLSRIFDAVLPSSSQQSPTKLAKRMLARSKTESSLDSPSGTQESTLERTASLPIIHPSPPKMERHASTSNLPSPSIRSGSQKAKPSVTKTYAGSFRSFLVPISTSQGPDASQSGICEGDDFESRESYNSLRTRWGVDTADDEPSSSPPTPSKSHSATPEGSPSKRSKGKGAFARMPSTTGMINPLKSISELRNKGESRRFLDEVGYLFEGMHHDGSISLRRASALEIITKMCDVDFMRKAKAADFFSRTWDLFLAAECGLGKDKILDALLVIFVAIIARDEDSLLDLSLHTQEPDNRSKSLLDILFQQLEGSQDADDPLQLLPQIDDKKLKAIGFTKREKPILMSINEVLTKRSGLLTPASTVSTSSLAVSSLRCFPPSAIPKRYFPALLHSFRCSLTMEETPLSASLPNWTSTASDVAYDCTYSHLQLFTNYLLGRWQPLNDSDTTPEQQEERNRHEMDKARDEWLVDNLLALAVCIELRMLSQDADDAPLQESMDLLLQALVSLTHHDKTWARKVVDSPYGIPFLLRMVYKTSQISGSSRKREDDSDDERDEYARALEQSSDTLCLVLGLLTNLVQTMPQSKDLLREIKLDPSCSLKRHACATKCSCPKQCSGLDVLVELYTQQTKVESTSSGTPPPDSSEAEAEAEASFIRSHLAVLFGLLMMTNPKNRKEILPKLPQPPSSTTQRAKVARLLEQAQLFLTFYTIVSSRIKEGDSESKVSKEVVQFLQNLRDGPGIV